MQTVRDAILTVIKPGEVLTARVARSRIEASGRPVNEGTVHNELGLLAHCGMLERVRPGAYRLLASPAGDSDER